MKLVRALAFAVATFAMSPSFAAEPVQWNGWSDELFSRATAEQRFVILDLEAVWCHWCHVMEKTTYADPEVTELLASKYIAVRVDQDANPDLSSRYGDWGWPATIVFAPDGTEIAKIRGYIEPARMQALLKAIIDDPSPGPSVGEAFQIKPSASVFLTKEQRAELVRNVDESYEDKLGGWGESQKYIDPDSMDHALTRAEAGDEIAAQRARQTFDAAIALIDPVWGGVFQYSEGGSWSKPHFEKIMSFQAQYLRQYSQAYALWKDEKYLTAARDIERYLAGFLIGPDGAFYVSQNADLDHDTDGHKYYALDDAGRRKLGMPRIDKNLYARENGWAISGLAAFYNVTNDPKVLAIAERCREMGQRQPRHARRRIPSWREGSRRSVPRRQPRDGTGVSRSLCLNRQSRLADRRRQGRRFHRRQFQGRGRRLLLVQDERREGRRVRQAAETFRTTRSRSPAS